jgi:hypothetical protein
MTVAITIRLAARTTDSSTTRAAVAMSFSMGRSLSFLVFFLLAAY